MSDPTTDSLIAALARGADDRNPEQLEARSRLAAAAADARGSDLAVELDKGRRQTSVDRGREQVARVFSTYDVPPDKVAVMDGLLASARALANMIVDNVPAGREQSMALTDLENAITHARAGVARACGVRRQ